MSTEALPAAKVFKTTVQLRMAKASYEEWERVTEFIQKLEELSLDCAQDNQSIGNYVRRSMPNMFRVCYGYRVLVDNCCDPAADTLEWKPELAEFIKNLPEKPKGGAL